MAYHRERFAPTSTRIAALVRLSPTAKDPHMPAQPLAALCELRPSVFDQARRDTVQVLSADFAERINASEFFEETFVTQGMRQLLTEALRRLAGKSDRGIFKLTQAMGGGKTHNLIALGLLAKHPELRARVLGRDYEGGVDAIRVVTFTGRDNDTPHGLWGAIAQQLGCFSDFSNLYQPLQAPGLQTWKRMLGTAPTLILLDELPPYLDAIRAVGVGDSNLAHVTKTALANLFAAVGEGGLNNACVVLTDLVGVYETENAALHNLLSTVQAEADRQALNLAPVRINSNEFYDILRTRLFARLPAQAQRDEVAQAYAQAIRRGNQMDVTAQSPEVFAASVSEAYPFHPSVKELYARFKENKGFQQTRALLRLMRVVLSSLWQSGAAAEKLLIGVEDIDPNNSEILSEIRQINATLENAISHDVARAGQAVAEVMDGNRGDKLATEVARMLLVASLANVHNAIKGLTVSEIGAWLARPGRNLDRLQGDIIEPLSVAAWHLHGADGRLYFRDIQNLNAKLESLAGSILRETAVAEVRTRLAELFKPTDNRAYQVVQVLPAIDQINNDSDKTALVIVEPQPGGQLRTELRDYWAGCQWKNRLSYLSGSRDNFQGVLDAAKRLKALQSIIADLDNDSVGPTDPQRKEADQLNDRHLVRFLSALKETFTVLWYPTVQRNQAALANADFLGEFTNNQYRGEQQVAALMVEKRKVEEDVGGDIFRAKVEQLLFTSKEMKWTEVKRNAGEMPAWQWHRTDALDKLKADAVSKGQWRERAGFVEKGPFAPEPTTVEIQQLSRDDATGECTLRIKAVRGDQVYWEQGAVATPSSARVVDNTLKTKALELSFVCVDNTHGAETGPAVRWRNTLTLKHDLSGAVGAWRVTLAVAPAQATIRYTVGAGDPRIVGGVYDGPFDAARDARVVRAIAQAGELESTSLEIVLPQVKIDEPEWNVDPNRPATWRREHKTDGSAATYEFIGRMKRLDVKASAAELNLSALHWTNLSFEERFLLTADQLQQSADFVRSLQAAGQVGLTIGRLHFQLGRDLLIWAHETGAEIRQSEVTQPAGNAAPTLL